MRPRASVVAIVFSLAALLLVPVAETLPAEARSSTTQSVPGMRHVRDVWCMADRSCLAVGATTERSGAVVVLHATGGNGPLRPVPGTQSLSGITCPQAGNCVAVGQGDTGAVVVDVDPTGTPGAVRTVPAASDVHDVACPTAQTCIATGQVWQSMDFYPYSRSFPVFVVITDGQPAPAQRFPRGADRLIGISCPSATTCLAAGIGRLAVLSEVNGTWSTSLKFVTTDSGYPTDGISCPSSSMCYTTAASQDGPGSPSRPAMMSVSPDGTAGPVLVLSERPGILYAISCSGVGACTVVGQDTSTSQGLVIDVRGTSARPATVWSGANYLTGVSCTAGRACAIVGNTPTNAVYGWHRMAR